MTRYVPHAHVLSAGSALKMRSLDLARKLELYECVAVWVAYIALALVYNIQVSRGRPNRRLRFLARSSIVENLPKSTEPPW